MESSFLQDQTFLTYLVYLVVSVALTIWVARTLFRNGQIFLVDVFRGNAALATSVNHLLVVGFYLLNLGFVSFNLKLAGSVHGSAQAVEVLSQKLGLVLLVLGGMHFLNLWVFHQMRHRTLLRDTPPPVEPDVMLQTAGPEAGIAP